MNLAGTEILVIIVIALLIFGPDKLPSALRSFGKVMGEIKKFKDAAQSEIEKTINDVANEPQSDAPKRKTTYAPDEIVEPIVDEEDK